MLDSTLHIYGIGRAVADKKGDTDIILVSMVELLPSLNGKLSHKDQQTTKVSKNPRGGSNNTKQNIGAGIPCKWWDFGSNRITAPDVVKDERVIIWRKGDSSSEFFWTPTRLDENKRTTEHVVHLYSDTPKTNRKPKKLNKDNSYSHTVSTKNGYIEFLTAKTNGEKFRYQLKIDSANNYAILKDDVGNRVYLNSAETLIELRNKEDTKIRLTKKDMEIYTPGNFTQITDGNYSLTVGGNLTWNISGSVTQTIGGSWTMDTGPYTLSCPGVDWTTDSVFYDTPDMTVTGVITAMALVIGGGGGGSGPACQISGAVQCDGPIVVTDTITAPMVNANQIVVGGGGIQSSGPIQGPTQTI